MHSNIEKSNLIEKREVIKTKHEYQIHKLDPNFLKTYKHTTLLKACTRCDTHCLE